MTQELLHYPNCLSDDISRNGFNARGTQSYKCRDCRRRFVLTPTSFPLSVQTYVNAKAKTVSQEVEVTKKVKKP